MSLSSRLSSSLASADLPLPFFSFRMERNFRDQEDATRLLSDSSPTGISRWNAAGELIYVNNAWFEQSE